MTEFMTGVILRTILGALIMMGIDLFLEDKK